MLDVQLGRLPKSARWLITLALISFALNHLFAGWLVWEVTTRVDASAKEHFSYKSLAALLRMAHQHTFGHGTMYLLTSSIFLFAGFSERITTLAITAAFVGAWLDLASWFLLKYGSERWEILSIVSGGFYFSAFAFMCAASLWRTWRPSPAPGAG